MMKRHQDQPRIHVVLSRVAEVPAARLPPEAYFDVAGRGGWDLEK